MLTSVAEHYRRSARLSAMALVEARRSYARGPTLAARTLRTYQLAAITLMLEYAPTQLAEQGLSTDTAGSVQLGSLVSDPAVVTSLVSKTATQSAFEGLSLSLVQDAGRTAAAVDLGRRPTITGYVRSLMPPSCSRCAILAGRVYRFSQGFQRHPRCDCLMTPTDQVVGPQLVTDPSEAYDRGWIRGLSAADREAVDAGADLGRVVNVRRREAGLTVGSSVYTRGGQLTPQAVLARAQTKEQALAGLKAAGYLF